LQYLAAKSLEPRLVVAIIDGIKVSPEKNVSLYKGEHRVSLPATCKIEMNGKNGFEMSPPYLAIYTVMNTSDLGDEIICEPQKCYITPIHSEETLVPISTELDRVLIDKAIGNIKYNQEKGIEIHYQKPLNSFVSPFSKQKVLPTLVVVSGGKQLFIDIDYVINDDNRERAEKRIDAIHEISDLVRVPVCDKDEDFAGQAFISINKAAKYVLGI